MGGATAGATGNGWEKAVATYGSGQPKQLTGELHTYQVLDFTNMKADTLTITSPTGAKTTFKNMANCSDLTNSCTPYRVKTISLSDGGNFSADYTFPLTYNVGNWSESNGKITTTPSATKTVKINCVRPAVSVLMSLMGKTQAEAANMKVVLVRYEFDVTGVTATSKTGNFMVYDPTVKTSGGAVVSEAVKAFPMLAVSLAVLMAAASRT